MSRSTPEALATCEAKRALERERNGVQLGEDGSVWVEGRRLRFGYVRPCTQDVVTLGGPER